MPKYKTYGELAAAFKSGELDQYYYLMLDKGGTENSLNYYNPELSDAALEAKQAECSELFNCDNDMEQVFKSLGIPCEWC